MHFQEISPNIMNHINKNMKWEANNDINKKKSH